MPTCVHARHPVAAFVIFFALSWGLLSAARADRMEDLTRALTDSSYKVRVQAALVLGKLGDRRAVPALIQALKDESESVRGVAATALGKLGDKTASNALLGATHDSSEFVRTQAKKALEQVAGHEAGSPEDFASGPRPGAKFYLDIGFGGASGNQYQRIFREALARELLKLPSVTLSVGRGNPTSQLLHSHRLQAFVVDGTIQRLKASGAQIDCDLKAFVATYPGRSIKMMTTEGASLQSGADPSVVEGAKRECLTATAEAVREDVGKFLRTLE